MFPSRKLLPLAWLALLSACGGQASEATASPSPTLQVYVTGTPTATRPAPVANATEESLLPSPTPFVHQVAQGETLLDIALRYGVSLDGLLAANPGIDPRFLSIDQELRIPGPDGQPADTLLPTSTPLPLDLDHASCFRAQSGALHCLVTAHNPTSNAVEGLTSQVSLLDSQGEVIDRSLAFAPLSRLPAGGRLPLSAYFAPPAPAEAMPRFSLLSAVASTSGEERYLPTELSDIETDPEGSATSWQVGGTLAVELPKEEVSFQVSLLIMALDGDGGIVGFTKWEPVDEDSPPYTFSLTVFSLGPAIDSVELLAEVVVLPE
jgi:LysM repeat protein